MFFDLHPMAGTIPAKGTVHITVSYTPQTYATVTMAFEVLLSQFNAKAVRCNVLASAKPGALKEEHKLQLTTANPLNDGVGGDCNGNDDTSGTGTGTGNDAAAVAKPRPPKHPKMPSTASPRRAVRRGGGGGGLKKDLVINNIKVPANRRGIQWVNSVLNQPAAGDSLKAAQLRTAAKAADESGVVLPRQRVEELFMMQLRANDVVPPGVGDLAPTEKEMAELTARRDSAAEAHDLMLGVGDAVKATSLARRTAVVGKGLKRTFREVKGNAALVAAKARQCEDEGGDTAAAPAPDIEVTFERRPGDGLRRRAYAMQRFEQAARKVILRNRAAARIAMLMDALNSGAADEDDDGAGAAAASSAPVACTTDADSEGAAATAAAGAASAAKPAFFFSDDAVDAFSFPAYEVPSILPVAAARDPVAVSLPQLPPPPPVFGQLVVPRQCDLLGYGTLDPEQYFPLCDEDEVPLMRLSVTERFLNGDGGGGNLDSSLRIGMLDSTTATALDQKEFAEGHIFNESSKYVTTFAAIKYSEVDIDHWFNPFGLKKAMPSTVIRKAKINTSKPVYNLVGQSVDLARSACPSAVTLPADPSLSNYWVPRLTNPYLESVLPSCAPKLLAELPADEAAGEEEEEEEEEDEEVGGLPVITMDDIYKEFFIPKEEQLHVGGVGRSAASEKDAEGEDNVNGALLFGVAEEEGGSEDGGQGAQVRSNVPYNKNGPIQREDREDFLESKLSTRQTNLVKDVAANLTALQHAYAGVSGNLHLALDTRL